MARWTPDPTFYPSPRLAMEAPPEELAYVALLNPDASDGRPDAIGVLDLDRMLVDLRRARRRSSRCRTPGDELHHFGWNACSAALCPWAPHPHVERRYLVVPGLRSSRIHVVDVGDDPRGPDDREGHRARGADATDRLLAARTPSHCGPEGIYMSALGGAENGGGPGGIFLLDCETFDLRGAWEVDRGPQHFCLRLLVAPRLRHADLERVGHAATCSRRGVVPEKLLGTRVRPPPARLGPARPPAPAGDRPRRRAPDGARAAAGARPAQDLRLRRRRRLGRGPLRLDLALVPRDGRTFGDPRR